ncbi:MAG: hypothetical protein CMM37_12360 [Rhodospirillaceae bacterium]|jgi:hypothetical protein|nr:hypothetical protein [Rhodospirillaceae bacterium]
MTARSLIIYSLITSMLVIAAIVAISSRPANTMIDRDRALIFPGVDAKLNDVASFKIRSAKRIYTIARTSRGWGVAELNGYAADFNKVKTVLVELSQLKFLEAKTSDPERFERLNLRDVTKKGAKSLEVTVNDQKGQVLASGLIGKKNEDLFGTGRGGTYMRIGKKNQTWLVEGTISIGEGPADWVDKKIVDIKRPRIRRIVVQAPGGGLTVVSRSMANKKDFRLAGIPAGKRQRGQWETNEMAKVLDKLELLDLKTVDEVPMRRDKLYKATMETFEGLLIHTRAIRLGKKFWVSFSASTASMVTDKKKVKKAADVFNTRHKGFVYEVKEKTGKKLTCDHKNLLEGAGLKACA